MTEEVAFPPPPEPTPRPQLARRVLHVGCGMPSRDRLPAVFQRPYWQEVRFDINPAVIPDIVGSITDLQGVADASVDAIWSSHNLEHVNSFEVPQALAAFRRVLKRNGFALITLPDLRAVARHIADDLLEEPLYVSQAGSISALDVIFGHQAAIERGNHYMAHRTGFTARTLGQALLNAGFAEVRVHEGDKWDLWAVATMPETPESVFEELAEVLT
jgi:SAM-dependent methyltransferase